MILLTGASGFIGRNLAVTLAKKKIPFEQVVRQKDGGEFYSLDFRDSSSWEGGDKQVVIHCAGLAHANQKDFADLFAEYRRVNVDGTLNLARQAASAGVQRFIFISSISVCGNSTLHNKPFTADAVPSPQDITGISKFEAEQGLRKISDETDMEIVIIRSPLVYGSGVKGNFASLIRLIEKGLPLPLGAIQNRRSLVAVDNLVDLVIACIDHPAAANQIFLASDGQDVSTPELLVGISEAMGNRIHMIPVPVALLKLAARILGKKAIADRLLGSLQVDISKAQKLLGWHPPISVKEGLRRCFQHRQL